MTSVFVRDGRTADIELAEPLPTLRTDSTGGVRILVRMHGRPVATLTVTTAVGELGPSRLAEEIWSVAGSEVRSHLVADGFPTSQVLGARTELPTATGETPCVARRAAALHRAPAITVLVATRDRVDVLRRCLSSIAELDYPDFDVVVVDNAPATEATARAVAELGGHCGPARIRYVREELPGLARAHNRGLAEATGSWVAITDDDVVVDRQWLSGIAEAAQSAPGVGCVTGLILPAELRTPAQRLLEQAGGFSRGFITRLYDTGSNRPDDPLFPLTAGRFGSGANMAYDTAVLRALGGFDPATGAGTRARGGDDLLGFLDVLVAGYGLAYEPAALLWHFHRRDYEELYQGSYNYGVGLGAYLTAALAHHPGLLPGILRNSMLAVRHFLGRSSPKNRAKTTDYPRELERAERRGVLHGPFGYVAGRWDALWREHRRW